MKIPIYQQQVTPNGGGFAPNARAGRSGLLDVAEGMNVIAGAFDKRERVDHALAMDQAQEDRRLQREQQSEQQRRQDADDRLAAVNAGSQADIAMMGHMQKRQEASPPGANGFTPSFLKDFDEYAAGAVQNAATPQAKQLLQLRLAQSREQFARAALGFEAQESMRYRGQQFDESLQRTAVMVSANPALFESKMGEFASLAKTVGSAAQQAKMIEAARSTLTNAAMKGWIDQNTQSAAAILEDIQKRGVDAPEINWTKAGTTTALPIKLGTLEDRQRWTNYAEQKNNREQSEILAGKRRAEIEADKAERKAEKAWVILSDLVKAGKNPDEATVQKYSSDMRGTAYENALPDLLRAVPDNSAAAMLPLTQQREQINALYQKRNTSGTNQELEKEITRREGVLKAAESDYGKDPLYAAAERRVIQAVAPINSGNIDSIISSIGPRVEQASTVAKMAEKPVSPLLADEAAKLGESLMALNPAQRSQKIAALSSAMPSDQARALVGQIEGKDRALALQFAAGMGRTTLGRYTSELIARGAQAVKDKAVKEDNAAMVGLKAQVADFIGEALTGKTREDVIDAARFIYLGQQAEGSGADIQRAARLALGGDIVEHNGKRIPVAAGVEDLPARIRAIPSAALAAQTPDGKVYLPGAGPMALADFMARLPDATLEPVGLGRYAVRSGGGLAANAAGRPIIIEVK